MRHHARPHHNARPKQFSVVAGAATLLALSGLAPARAQAPNVNGYTYQISGQTSVSTDWKETVLGATILTYFNGSNNNQAFPTLPLVFTQSGSSVSATFYLPMASNMPYGAGNPHVYPLTFNGTYNTGSGAFNMTANLGSSTQYNEVGTANLNFGIISGTSWVYQRYTSGTLTFTGNASYLGGTKSTQLTGLSLGASSLSESIQASTSSTDPTSSLSLSSTNGDTITGLDKVSISNSLSFNMLQSSIATPGPSALAVFAPGLSAGLLLLRRRRRV